MLLRVIWGRYTQLFSYEVFVFDPCQVEIVYKINAVTEIDCQAGFLVCSFRRCTKSFEKRSKSRLCPVFTKVVLVSLEDPRFDP